jgi:hypothetical protein
MRKENYPQYIRDNLEDKLVFKLAGGIGLSVRDRNEHALQKNVPDFYAHNFDAYTIPDTSQPKFKVTSALTKTSDRLSEAQEGYK